MKKYEYRCVFIWGFEESTTRTLNQYGTEGWELVTAWWCWHYFKKPVE